ncbi:type IV secretion system protein VirB10 [Paucibacter sp. DJ2R-2]|uniref:type IV secretion system protein VirB10 n=1 Tax=Paucibacter sp. DJ2R-2 TaxID=2893558 RepID=UPI0021E38621|nr:type IV secretion system protein VirB10 [Paucibacter sp. DJ2R-2]MCV2438579.1 type IV secretion system protein VirB10 [Paucibacter sp. DJ2R-2]
MSPDTSTKDRTGCAEPSTPSGHRDADAQPGFDSQAPGMAPLPGEPAIPDVCDNTRRKWSKKGLWAVGLLIFALSALTAMGIQRLMTYLKKPAGTETRSLRDRPMAASLELRKFDLVANSADPSSISFPPAKNQNPSPSGTVATVTIPAPIPTSEDLADPIGVRKTSASNPGRSERSTMHPEDAPILLVSTRPVPSTLISMATLPRTANESGDAPQQAAGAIGTTDALDATARNLQEYQARLQTLLASLTQGAELAASPKLQLNEMPAEDRDGELAVRSAASRGSPISTPGDQALAGFRPTERAASGNGLFGGQLQASSTARVMASRLSPRSLMLPKGTAFTCALKTRVISATSGLLGCQVQRHVYSEDGRVLLIERGSHLDGEYRVSGMKPGSIRIPVLWTRIRTPLGIVVDLDSPGTGPLGESGIEGHVDKRWGERIGAALLLSLIDDSVKLVIQNQSEREPRRGGNDTVVLPSTTANTSKLAEKVLDSTINIPPLIYQNQGALVGIYVAHDVDFSSVYELRPAPRSNPRQEAP